MLLLTIADLTKDRKIKDLIKCRTHKHSSKGQTVAPIIHFQGQPHGIRELLLASVYVKCYHENLQATNPNFNYKNTAIKH